MRAYEKFLYLVPKLLKFHKKSTAGYTMHRFILHFALASLLILAASCTKEEPVQPPPPPPTEPDTTTHEYTWETIYIGDAQSYLSDVFAVSDTDVWAVGEIYLKDSTGKLDQRMYNAAHFDGMRWNIMRVKFYWQGDSDYAQLLSIFGYSSQNVWVGSSSPGRWDGKKWSLLPVTGIHDGWINRMFGRNPNELYMVGTNGASSYFDGVRFQKMETNTTIDLTDVYGNANEVWAVGGHSFGKDGIVMRKSNLSWEKDDTLSTWSVHSIWCDEKGLGGNGFLVFAGDGIRYYDSTWKKPPDELTGGRLGFGSLYFNAVRGTSRKNVFAVGEFGIVLHFNGRTWHMYDELFCYPKVFILKSVSITTNKVFIVGVDNSRGFVLIGKKK